MSDSNTNVEIEDVLSSIRRLVSEDRSGARSTPPAEVAPPAPMAEGVQVESATITHLQPRGMPANARPAPAEAPATAETRIDAAIVALNAETVQAPAEDLPQPAVEPAYAATEAVVAVAAPETADLAPEGELVDTSDLLAEPYQQAGAKGAQFVLTPDFLVDATTTEPAQDPELSPEDPVAAAPSDQHVPVEPSSRPDLSLNDLVSGEALLATFGSVGVSPTRPAWDSDGLADLAPRLAPRSYPLHPTLEATIADLEMAVAAQSEEFEPDQGEDLGEDLTLDSPLEFGALPDHPDAAAESAYEPGADATRLEWEVAEASVEAAVPMRRHRFHLNADPVSEPVVADGYIGISDAFPAEDQDYAARPAPASESPEPVWPSADAFGDEFADLAVAGPSVDLEQATDEGLLGLGDAIDAPRIDFDGTAADSEAAEATADARAGEAEGYPDPTVATDADSPAEGAFAQDVAAQDVGADLASDTYAEAEPAVVATPARRIFIAPRVDLTDADGMEDRAGAGAEGVEAWDAAPAEEDIAEALVQGAADEMTQTLADDVTEQVTVALGAASASASEAAAASLLPQSADLWQVGPAGQAGDEDVAYPAVPPLSTEDLRGLVLELIRQELQGPLGERITRNVRKLVRREINRALESRDLD